jgi:hypothetical protein
MDLETNHSVIKLRYFCVNASFMSLFAKFNVVCFCELGFNFFAIFLAKNLGETSFCVVS